MFDNELSCPQRYRTRAADHARWKSHCIVAGACILLSLLACSSNSPSSAPQPDAAAAQNAPPAATPSIPVDEVASALRDRLSSGADPVLGALTRTEQTELAALYEPEAQAPLWLDPDGRPTRSARDALALLEDAASEGLDPEDYAAASLRSRAAALEATAQPSTEDLAFFDAAMSAAALRYFRHLHLGRVDPRTIGFKLDVAAEEHDFVMLLRSALGNQRIAETAAELAPPLVQYRLLRSMLGRYRSLAAMPLAPLPPFAGTVRPGDPLGGLDAVHRRLVALGDLPPETPAPVDGSSYDGPIVEGVKRLQVRHGLEADGILGKATQTALSVPLAWRVRQIEFALERLRWLPDLEDRRFIGLNIPMFYLWGWDSVRPDGIPSFGMRAIVGRALSTETPIIADEMRHVIFRPYWNVPPSILRNEILPILDRDLDYLRRQDMEIVRGPGDDARPIAATADVLPLLRQGTLRVRQRPGPRNALGLVKFVFPNNDNIYLHSTPAQELFHRARRDFSHGCVRVEDPVLLAEWVLKDQPEWTRDRILAAMSGSRPQQVNLTQPIQVILFYLTAAVMPEDGSVHFADDIYRHDERLDRALSSSQPAR